MKLSTLIIAGSFALSGLAAQAHEAKGPNGGKLVDASVGHIEFTHAANEITIFITDENDKPLKTTDAKGRAVIQNAGKTAQAEFAPGDPNKLVAKLDAPLAKGAVVVVSGTVVGKAVQARFTVE